MIPTIPEEQQKLADYVKKRAVQLAAIKSFAESKKEMSAEIAEAFGKGIDLDALASAYLKDDKKKRAAEEVIAKTEEAVASVSILGKYINTGDNVHDLADKYMEV